MKIKARFVSPQYNEGLTRLKRKFAFIPTLIGAEWVWLESYEVLQVWRIEEQKVTIEEQELLFFNGYWKNISTRVCE